jgi:hypothetical protein
MVAWPLSIDRQGPTLLARAFDENRLIYTPVWQNRMQPVRVEWV